MKTKPERLPPCDSPGPARRRNAAAPLEIEEGSSGPRASACLDAKGDLPDVNLVPYGSGRLEGEAGGTTYMQGSAKLGLVAFRWLTAIGAPRARTHARPGGAASALTGPPSTPLGMPLEAKGRAPGRPILQVRPAPSRGLLVPRRVLVERKRLDGAASE